jgi:hypothetical protein
LVIVALPLMMEDGTAAESERLAMNASLEHRKGFGMVHMTIYG